MRLAKALEKLLQDAHPTRQKELYEACAKALDALRKEGDPEPTNEEPPHQPQQESPSPSQDANLPSSQTTSSPHAEPAENFVYWQPFRVALDRSMPIKTRELALGCLHSLIAYKSFRGAQLLTTSASDANPGHVTTTDRGDDFTQVEDSTTTPNPIIKPSKTPLHVIDDVIHQVCTCFVLTQNEDSVQLQVIKVLLTAVTTDGIEVHNISLLKVIQTCCNVYLYSRNQANQLTAKASLTQMVNFILQRMEVKQAELRRSAPQLSSSTSSSLDENGTSMMMKEGEGLVKDSSFVEEKGSVSDGSSEERRSVSESSSEEKLSSPPEETGGDSFGVDANMPDPESSSSSAQADANATTQPDSLRINIPPLSEGTSSETVVGANSSPYNATLEVYAAILKKDVLLMVRLFCKLSMKPDKEGMDDPTTPNMRGRILVLELLLSIMTNSGYTFQKDASFVPLVRQLCVSLSRNGVSTNPTLFELCLSLFLMILRHFRARLKAEVEVLFNEIYLHILDMSNSTYKQKSMVLQGLVKICADPHTLVDIYVNYDCDLAMISIFEKMVNALSRVAQSKNGKTSSEKTSGGLLTAAPDLSGVDAAQDRRLKMRGLECFVAVVNSLVEWSRDAYSPSPMASTEKDRQKKPTPSAEKEGGISTARPMSSSSSSTTTEQKKSSQPPVVVSKKPLSAITMHGQANGSSTSTGSGYDPSPHRVDTPPPVSTASNGDVKEPAQYEEMLSRKRAFEATATLFNSKPTKGLQSFIDQGFVEDDPASIARFIHATNTLSKSAIGELIGEADDRSIKVMYAFIDMMRFESPTTKESGDSGFVKAMRIFLQAFRLPGESQKISRIMEKFADRYCDCNPTVFPNADAAYILAYSVIMLNTDQHSNQVKNRMDKGMFLKNNRGQCNGSDFPDDFLGAIFDEISSNEIIMEEEQISEIEKQAIWSANANDKQRREMYRRETAQMQKKSQALFKGHERRKIAPFRSAVHIEHVRPMFAVACWPLMATLSTVFEETPDSAALGNNTELNKSNHSATLGASEQIGLCLDGFTGAIRISSVFRMETERDAFVTSLAKLTGLSRVQDLRSKNVAAIRNIIGIGSSYGEYLEGSWTTILSVISQMDRLQLIGNSNSQETVPSTQDTNGGIGRMSSPVRMTVSFLDRLSGGSVIGGDKQQGAAGTTGPPNVDLVALCNRRPSFANLVNDMQSQATLIAVDRIFTGTVSLSGTAIVHFFNSLCQVSLVEVDVNSNRRMYSLSRIVEMAYYNMGRIRYEWTQIWKVLQPHFNVVGCHSNVQVATFAVDSLRQLSMKFLDRDELSHFHTQNEFLKPFEHIMRMNNTPVIRDLIIRSFHQMISARARNIKSGWKSIFVVLSRAAACGDPPIIESAFSIVQWIFTEYFDHVGASFIDYVSCLVEFAFASSCEDVVTGAIRLLVACARSLLSQRAEEEVTAAANHLNSKRIEANSPTSDFKQDGGGSSLENVKVEEDIFFLKWFPILSGLSRIIIDSESSAIRTKAVDAMFDLLKASGHQLQLPLWKSVYRSVLMPIFEDLKDPDLKKREAYSVVWIQALRLMVDLYSNYYEVLSPQIEFTQVLLDLMILLVGRKSENLSQTGVLCLHQLVSANGHRFTPEIWECVTTAVEKMFAATTPGELIEYDAPAKKWIAGGLGDRSSGDGRRSNSMSSSNGAHSLSTAALTESNDPDRTEFPYSLVIVKCAVHLVTIQSLRDIAFNDATSHFVVMPKEHRDRWLQCLYRSYLFAHTFNDNYDLRLFLWKTRRVPQMPNLIKQETLSITTYLQILFHLYRTHGDETASDVLELAVRESQSVLHRFVPMLEDPQKYSRDLASWSNLVIAIYRELLTIPWDVDRGRNVPVLTDPGSSSSDEKSVKSMPDSVTASVPPPRTINLIGIRKQLPEYFKLANKLVVSEKVEIRSVVQGFMERIADRFLADA